MVHHPFEAEWFYRFVANVRDCFIDRIGRVDQVEIGSSDHSSLRDFVDEIEQFFPIIGSHDHNREIFDLPGLNQSERFEQLIERACAARHDNKGVGIFHQERFAGEKVMHPHAAIEIGVRRLLRRQLDSATNRTAAGFLGAAVCSFHYTRAAAGYDCETQPRNGSPHLSSQFIMRIAQLNPGRAKNSHAWTNEMKRAKSAQEIAHHSQEGEEFSAT